jgi:UDP-N-acetylmuramate dehydrogenase
MAIPNTMALPCMAERTVLYERPEQLSELQALFDRHGSLRVLGGASNVILPATLDQPLILVRNLGVGLVAQTDQHWLVEVAAGENWHTWVQTSLSRGWPGLENLALIPGTVGAAPIQNIGAYGVELAQYVDAIEIWDFGGRTRRWLSVEQCKFGYRDSVFKQTEGRHWLVLSVRFALPRVWQPVLGYPDLQPLTHWDIKRLNPQAVFDQVVAVRQSKLPDPAVQPNVGSFFKNPVVSQPLAQALKQSFAGIVTYTQTDGQVKLAAGWLIDQCGFKGKQMGPVSVHDRQALVLVNNRGATADDVLTAARTIADAVAARFGVSLEMEPSYWGR